MAKSPNSKQISPFYQSDKFKMFAALSAISVTIGSAILLSKYRAAMHDNIPMIAMEEFHPIQGHYPAILRARQARLKLVEWIYQAMKRAEYPSICCISRPPNTRLVLVSNPQLIRYIWETNFPATEKSVAFQQRYDALLGRGIFNVNGEEWRFHRKIASRMFSMRNLRDYMFNTTIRNTHSTMNKLRQLLNDTIDINDILGRYTLDTFCEIAFGKRMNIVEIYPEEHAFGVAFDNCVEHVSYRAGDVLWKLKRFLNIGSEAQITKETKVIEEFVQKIVDNRDSNVGHMADASGDASYDILSLYLKFDPTLTIKQLKDICSNFIIAGRDTTRLLLSWFIWHLCKDENKDIKRKVYEEIDAFDGEPLYQDFNNESFRYLGSCLCETLRLTPSVPLIGRSAVKDLKLPKVKGDKMAYTLRKDDIVIISNYAQGRNPKVWGSDCLQFKPERWQSKGVNSHDQYKFAAFNVNPRLCLGKNFAIQEAKIFTYYFMKNFEFNVIKGYEVIVKGGALLNMANGLPVVLKAR
eukprot:1045020_1